MPGRPVQPFDADLSDPDYRAWPRRRSAGRRLRYRDPKDLSRISGSLLPVGADRGLGLRHRRSGNRDCDIGHPALHGTASVGHPAHPSEPDPAPRNGRDQARLADAPGGSACFHCGRRGNCGWDRRDRYVVRHRHPPTFGRPEHISPARWWSAWRCWLGSRG